MAVESMAAELDFEAKENIFSLNNTCLEINNLSDESKHLYPLWDVL